MAQAIFKVFLNLIKTLVNIFLTPMNLLIANLFPDLTILITTFNKVITDYLAPYLGFFARLIPPGTKNLIVLYIGILISYYTVSITLNSTLKIIHIIKTIKFW